MSKDTVVFEKGGERVRMDVKTQKRLTVEKDLKNSRHLLHFRQPAGLTAAAASHVFSSWPPALIAISLHH